MTGLSAERRVAYRERSVWLWVLSWLVCFVWEETPPGSPQTILAAIPLPIGGLIEISPRGTTRVPVTGPIKDHTEDCGGVEAYFSR
jgi:hypothetical protein